MQHALYKRGGPTKMQHVLYKRGGPTKMQHVLYKRGGPTKMQHALYKRSPPGFCPTVLFTSQRGDVYRPRVELCCSLCICCSCTHLL